MTTKTLKEIDVLNEIIAWLEARQKETGIYNGSYQKMKEGYIKDVDKLLISGGLKPFEPSFITKL